MKAAEAVAHMARAAGLSKSRLSQLIGRHRNFIASSQNRENWHPQTDTLSALARSCGYELVLEGHNERIVIDD